MFVYHQGIQARFKEKKMVVNQMESQCIIYQMHLVQSFNVNTDLKANMDGLNCQLQTATRRQLQAEDELKHHVADGRRFENKMVSVYLCCIANEIVVPIHSSTHC